MYRTFRDNKTNTGCNLHLNFSWVNNQGHGYEIHGNLQEFQQQQENISTLEDLLVKYITKTEAAIQNQQAVIKNMKTQVEQIKATVANGKQCILPSDTEKNLIEQVLTI